MPPQRVAQAVEPQFTLELSYRNEESYPDQCVTCERAQSESFYDIMGITGVHIQQAAVAI